MRSKRDDKRPNCHEQREKKKTRRTLLEENASLEDKSCGIDHAYSGPPVPGIKEENWFLLNSLRWRMTHTVSLAALRWCVKRNGKVTEQKNTNNPLALCRWRRAVITRRFWFWFSSLNEKRGSVIVAVSNSRPAGVFLRHLTYLLRGPFTPRRRCCQKCPHSLPVRDWI